VLPILETQEPVADLAGVVVAALRQALALVAPLDRVMPVPPRRRAALAAAVAVQERPAR